MTAIARDSGGTMWAATSRGLARLVGARGRRSTPPPDIREATPSRSSWTGAGRSGQWRETGSTSYREERRASRSASRPGLAAAMASWTWRRRRTARSGPSTAVWRVPRGGRPRGPAAIPYARSPRYRHLLPGLVPRQSRGGHWNLGPARPSVASCPRGRWGRDAGNRFAKVADHPFLPHCRHEWKSHRGPRCTIGRGASGSGPPTGMDRFRETKLTRSHRRGT